MFVAIYRWRVRPEREADFVAAWERVTRAIHASCGSGGSALFRDDDGTFVAVARWPDRETRDRCEASGADDLAIMRACIEESFPERRLECVSDLWDDGRRFGRPRRG